MKLHYYAATDSLYVEFRSTPSVETREITNGFIVDFDAERAVVGLDIDHASRRIDLTVLESRALPLRPVPDQ